MDIAMKDLALTMHRAWRRILVRVRNPRRLAYGDLFVVRSDLNIVRNCRLTVGRRVSIGLNCIVMADVEVGDDVMISSRVSFVGRDHPLGNYGDSLYEHEPNPAAKIEIGSNVLIGFGATIVGPCRVGDGAVIATGAVVTRDVEPESIVGGVPAVRIGDRWKP